MTKAIVGLATCGIAAGAETVLQSLKEKVKAQKLPVEVGITGCIGMCYQEPLLEIRADSGELAGRVKVTGLAR